MNKNSSAGGSEPKQKKKFSKVLRDDFKEGDLKKTFFQEMKDIYYFYLDEEERKKLDEMNKVKKFFLVAFRIIKSMFLKLTPMRRLLLFAGLILMISRTANNSNAWPGITLFFIVLMLELKDKLLAHDEFAVGRAVQTALIPETNPEISGWDIWMFTRPAKEIGGDFVDYLELDNDRMGLALGDVAGKGLGAALFMAKLQATLRAIAHNYDSLGKLGAQINTIFCRDGIPNKFASLVYLEIKPDKGSIRLLNAGHIPPLILRKEKLEELSKGGTALGIMEESVYEEQKIEMLHDDLIIVYSDGVTDAVDTKGNLFGEERFLEFASGLRELSAEKAGEKILRTIEQFVGEARPSDDLSLIILKKA